MTSPTAKIIGQKDGDRFVICPGCLARVDVRNLSEVLKHMHSDDAGKSPAGPSNPVAKSS